MKENKVFGGCAVFTLGDSEGKSESEQQNGAMIRFIEKEFKSLSRAAGLEFVKLRRSPFENGDVGFCAYEANVVEISEPEILRRMRMGRLVLPILAHELGHFCAYVHGCVSHRGKRAIEKQADILGACILKEAGMSPNLMVTMLSQEWESERRMGRRKITVDPDSYPSFWERAETVRRFIKNYWKGSES